VGLEPTAYRFPRPSSKGYIIHSAVSEPVVADLWSLSSYLSRALWNLARLRPPPPEIPGLGIYILFLDF
jgi:hypothetical protein